MKRVFDIPKFRIEEFTSLVLDGEDIKVYHLYINDTLYIVSPKEITAFDINNDFAVTGNLLF